MESKGNQQIVTSFLSIRKDSEFQFNAQEIIIQNQGTATAFIQSAMGSSKFILIPKPAGDAPYKDFELRLSLGPGQIDSTIYKFTFGTGSKSLVVIIRKPVK